MKRDMDLVRKILLEIENSKGFIDSRKLELENYSSRDISFHIAIIVEAGFINLITKSSNKQDGNVFLIDRLTWSGCEFLESIRDKNIWKKIKQKLQDGGGSFTIDIIKALAIFELKNKLGI